MSTGTTLQAIDHTLWQHQRHTSAGEPDFLHALHRLSTLQELREALQQHAARPGYHLRVSTVGLDRNPLVCEPLPKPRPKRELGDLAIVVTRADRALLRRRLWIVQSKTQSSNWLTSLGIGKEIELYEHRPDFELLTSSHPQAKSLGRFALGKAFPRVADDVPPFWSYVLFAEASPDGVPMSIPPVRHVWPSSPQRVQTSFTEGLVRMLEGVGHAMGHGADVDKGSPHEEWRRLFLAVWRNRNAPWRTAHHYASTAEYDDVTTHTGVRFTSTGFSSAPTAEDLERYRRLATADDDAVTTEPASAPSSFDGPEDGPRMPMLLIDQVFASAPR